MSKSLAFRSVAVLGLFYTVSAVAQVEPLSAEALEHLENNRFDALVSTAQESCNEDLEIARSSMNDIFRRREAAEAALACITRQRGLFTAAASTAEKRLRLNAAFKPFIEETQTLKEQREAATDFMGFTWGVGFGFSFGSETIENATIVNNVVRATERRRQEPRVLLEFHKYFWCNDGYTDETRGCGPFIAASTSDSSALSVGLGFMYGFRRPNDKDSDGFSIGAGFILDSEVKTLGDGFAENAPPPAGETAVRFEEKSRWSLLIFATRTF